MIIFTYGVNTLQLPNPKLGEPNQVSPGVTAHYASDGSLRTYIKPVTQRYTLTFDLLTDTDIENLRTWLAEYDGSIITYTDWLSNTMQVRLLTEQLQITKIRNCQYSAILELRKV